MLQAEMLPLAFRAYDTNFIKTNKLLLEFGLHWVVGTVGGYIDVWLIKAQINAFLYQEKDKVEASCFHC